jgi:hypothetical protein
VYCPDLEIDPGPLLASPPKSDQVTAAVSPLANVAVNCSTEVPLELVALHPVQLVSMEVIPGEIEKLELEEAAVTPALAQPETNHRTAGAIKMATS